MPYKMSRRRRLFLMWYLIEEMEHDEFILRTHVAKRAQIPFQPKNEKRACLKLINNLREDNKKFSKFFRLSIEQFDFVLGLIKDDIYKKGSNRNSYPITPDEKLAVTLRYLATGGSFQKLRSQFRISVGQLSQLMRHTLAALKKRLVPLMLPTPTQENLEEKAKEFELKWNFPNCAGAIDGKHIRIVCRDAIPSVQHESTVLLAVVDANCKFTYIDVGSYGKEGAVGIFERSVLGKSFNNETLLPPPCKLPNSDRVLPYVLAGGEAFRLHPNLMRPYAQERVISDNTKTMFNERLCRAHKASEKAFGILANTFRIFFAPFDLLPQTVENIVVVACCLHNLLRDASIAKTAASNVEKAFIPEHNKDNLISLEKVGGFAKIEGFEVRDSFAAYFSNEGRIESQANNTD